mmetsp:Transcript_21393/g.53857  ORF Transcript_21393/g.53857 Transcript_21393/m.53857 type:complete len:221 (-) Transcript_21393:1098-1760(-)
MCRHRSVRPRRCLRASSCFLQQVRLDLLTAPQHRKLRRPHSPTALPVQGSTTRRWMRRRCNSSCTRHQSRSGTRAVQQRARRKTHPTLYLQQRQGSQALIPMTQHPAPLPYARSSCRWCHPDAACCLAVFRCSRRCFVLSACASFLKAGVANRCNSRSRLASARSVLHPVPALRRRRDFSFYIYCSWYLHHHLQRAVLENPLDLAFDCEPPPCGRLPRAA